MASTTGRTRRYGRALTPADLYLDDLDRQRQAEQEQSAWDYLKGTGRYDPQQLEEFRAVGGTPKAVIPAPRPSDPLYPAKQALEILNLQKGLADAQRALNDPERGMKFDTRTDPNGMRYRVLQLPGGREGPQIPIKDDAGMVSFEEKPDRWKGYVPAEGGERWAAMGANPGDQYQMGNDRWGNVTAPVITKRSRMEVKERVNPDRSIVEDVVVRHPETGETLKEFTRPKMSTDTKKPMYAPGPIETPLDSSQYGGVPMLTEKAVLDASGKKSNVVRLPTPQAANMARNFDEQIREAQGRIGALEKIMQSSSPTGQNPNSAMFRKASEEKDTLERKGTALRTAQGKLQKIFKDHGVEGVMPHYDVPIQMVRRENGQILRDSSGKPMKFSVPASQFDAALRAGGEVFNPDQHQ